MTKVNRKTTRRIGLYIHIPFCIRKCNYCGFLSFPENSQEGCSSSRAEYADFLCMELENTGKSINNCYHGSYSDSRCDFTKKNSCSRIHHGSCSHKRCDFTKKNSYSSLDQGSCGDSNCDFTEKSTGQSEHQKMHSPKHHELYTVDTVFIGGGTPSLLAEKEITAIISTIKTHFHIESDAEITIETNPGTLTESKLKLYRELGINRLSIGLQSFDNNCLKTLGRIHSEKDFITNYFMARKLGFSNINIDLMFGFPGHSMKVWKDSLKKAINLRPEHISFYSMQLEENTPFYKAYKNEEIDMPDDDLNNEMYHYAQNVLRNAGYTHYEISNASLPGYECRHNLKYWNMEEYLGAGLGAHSYLFTYPGITDKNNEKTSNEKSSFENALKNKSENKSEYFSNRKLSDSDQKVRYEKISDNKILDEIYLYNDDILTNGIRFHNTEDIEEYYKMVSSGKCPVRKNDINIETDEDAMSVFVFTGLRKAEGINLNEFHSKFGLDFYDVFSNKKDVINEFTENGLLEVNDERIRLTRNGIDVSNDIMCEFTL